jgi:hypothetical protein
VQNGSILKLTVQDQKVNLSVHWHEAKIAAGTKSNLGEVCHDWQHKETTKDD